MPDAIGLDALGPFAAAVFGYFLGSILFLAVNPSPHFIKLQPLRLQVVKYKVLIVGTNFANLDQEPHDGFLRNARQANGRTN